MNATTSKPKRQEGLSDRQRIEKYRVVNGECWESALSPGKLYPRLKISGKNVSLHRAAYEAYVEPIPDGKLVLHHCDNPRCHRPSHLYVGTHSDNNRDVIARNRANPPGPHNSHLDPIILALGPVLSQSEIAECAGVSQSYVSTVLRRAKASRGRTTSFGKGHGLGGRHKKVSK